MKANSTRRLLQAATASLALAIPAILSATAFTWDITPGTVGAGDSAITGGTGSWNTTVTLGNWTSDAGANNVAWDNTPTDSTAIFGGTAGTVTLTTVSANALTFDTTGYTLTASTLTLNGSSPTITANADATIASTLAGSAGLVKSGTGKLTLSAVNTYTGGTTVDAGTLSIIGAAGNTRIVGALTVNPSGTVDVSNGTETTGLGYNNQLTSVAINGGTITTTGGSHIWNITSGLTMTGGTLQSNNGVSTTAGGSNQLEWNRTVLNTLASSNTATIAGRINIRNDSGYTGVVFNVAEGAAATDLLVSAGITQASAGMGITKNGAGTMVLTAANTYSGATTVNAGTLVLSGTNGSVLTSAVAVNSGATLRLDNTTNSTNRLGDGVAVSLNGGTLDISHGGALGANYAETAGVVTTAVGSTISTSQADVGQTSILTLGGLVGSANFTGTGLGVDDRNKIIITGKSNGSLVGTLNGTGLAIYDTTLGVTATTYTDVPFGGTINNGAATNIRLSGGDPLDGDVVLAGDPTTVNNILQNQNNPTTIDSGSQVLRLGTEGGIVLPVGMASLTIGNGTLTAGGAADTAGTLNLTNNDGTSLLTANSVIANNGAGVVGLVTGGTGKVVVAGTNSYTGTTVLGAGTTEFPGATQTISSIVSGAGGLLKSNAASTLTLSGANTFTGAINITGGVLKLGNATGLGTSSQIVTVASGATFDLAGSTASRPVTISGTGVSGQAALYNSSTTTGATISSLKLDNNATTISAVTGSDVNKVVGFGTLDLNGKKLTIGGGGFTVGLHSITSGDIDINSGGFLYSQNGGSQTSVTGTITINSGGVYETRDASNTAMTSVHAIYLNGGTLSRATITNNNGGGAGTTLKNNITVDATNGGTITNNTGSFAIYYRLTGALSGSGPLALNGSMGVEFQGDGSGYTGTATATNGTVSFSTGGTQVFNGNLAGNRPVVKWGAGTTTLGGTTSFSGSLTVNGGTAVLSGASNTANGTTTVNSGTTLRLSYGTNDNRKISSGALTLSGGTIELAGGTFADSVASTTLGAGSLNSITRSSGTSTLDLGTITVNVGSRLNLGQSGIARTANTNNGDGILGTWATIGGSQWAMNDGTGLIVAATTVDITRRDSGTKIIPDGASSHVRLVEGTGTLGNITLGAATTTVSTLTQSAVDGASAATIDPAGQTLAANAVVVGTGAGALTIGTGTNNGTLKPVATSLEFRDYAGAGITVNSIIADGTGASTVTKNDGGTLAFPVANTYTGGTTVNGGTLQATLGNTAGARSNFGSGAITVNSGATLLFTAGSTTNAMSHANAINLNGATLRSNDAVQTYAGDIALTGANTVDVVYAGKNAIFSGLVSGAGSLTKTNNGTLILSGTNTYTGGTTLTSGPLRAASTGALGASGQTLTLNGGTLELGSDTGLSSKNLVIGGNVVFTIDRATLGAGVTTTFGNLTSTSGSRTLTFTRGTNVVGPATMAFNGLGFALAGQTTTFAVGANTIVDLSSAGLIAGAQTVSIVKSDSGTLILGDYGNWDGGSNTSLTGGTLELRGVMGDSGVFRGLTASAGTTLRLANDANKLYYSGVTAAGGMIIEAGRITSGTTSMTHSLGTLSSGGTLIVNRAATITGAGTGTVTFTGAATLTSNSTYIIGANAALNLQGAIGGAFTLAKNGAGTLAITATSTYSGATTLGGGTTTLSGATGAIASSSGITINGGATLALANTTAANNGNRIAGTFAMNGGTLNFTNDAGAASFSESTGALTIGGGINTINAGQAASGQTSALTFASLARTSGFVNFTGTGLGAVDNRNRILITGQSAGLIGGWATYNATDFAGYDLTQGVVANATYTDVDRLGGLISSSTTSNIRIIEAGAGVNVSMAAAGTTDINTLLQNANGGPAVVDVGVGNTLRLGAAGGILLPAASTDLTISNGTLTAGGNAVANNPGRIAMTNYHATNPVTIGSVIANNGSGIVGVDVLGTGTTSLTGVNTYTDTTTIGTGATLQIGGAGQLGSGTYAVAITNNGSFKYSSSAAQTITGVISGTGSVLKDGAGNLAMGSASFPGNTFTGGLTATNGLVTIQGNNTGTSVAGAGTLTIGTGATVRALSHNALGQGSGLLSPLFVNGGTFEGAEYNHINTITMTGGTISPRSGITVVDGLDMKVYAGVNPNITTNAAAGTAAISLKINNSAAPMTVTVADGLAATDLSISGVVVGTQSFTKAGAGLLGLTATNTFTGGTVVNAGILSLNGGGGSPGTIRGTVTVNSGATLQLNNGDVTGYSVGTDSLKTINLVGGTLHVNVTNNQTLGNAAINLTGASITGVTNSNIDFFQGSSSLNSLASATTSTVSGVKLSIRQTLGLTIAVADGAASTDLQIDSAIVSNGGFTTAPLTKTGTGTLTLTGNNTYSGNTLVNGGKLTLTSTSQMRFVLGNSAATNSASGSGQAEFKGVFNIETGAVTDASGTWTIASVATQSFDDTTFSVAGFTDPENDGTWTKAASHVAGSDWTFNEANGTLVLAPSGGYTTWAATNAPTGSSTDDFDGDGVPNGVEYVLGGDKDTNDLDKLPVVGSDGTNMTFTFIRSKDSIKPDTAVAIQVDTDLIDWPTSGPDYYPVPDAPEANTPGVTVVDNAPANTQTITLTIPMAPDAAKFARLNVIITE